MIYKLAPHIHLKGHDPNVKNPTIKEILDFFSDYDIITLTVHSFETNEKSYLSFVEECKKYSTPEKLIIPCLEDESKSYHLLLIGAQSYTNDVFNPDREYLTVLAHPFGFFYQGRKVKKENLDLDNLDGLEIWNFYHNSKKYPSLKTLKFFQQFPKTVKAYISLDEHPPFKKRDVVMLLECENLNKENVLKTLKEGKFYSKVKDFIINNQGDIRQYKKNIDNYTKIKCLMRESLIHMISLLAITGNNWAKRLGIKTSITHKIKRIVHNIRRSI